jgi:hypothetical protein
MTLAGTSHYSTVEQEDLFGSVVQVFLQTHDPAPAAAGQLEYTSVQLPAALVRSPSAYSWGRTIGSISVPVGSKRPSFCPP